MRTTRHLPVNPGHRRRRRDTSQPPRFQCSTVIRPRHEVQIRRPIPCVSVSRSRSNVDQTLTKRCHKRPTLQCIYNMLHGTQVMAKWSPENELSTKYIFSSVTLQPLCDPPL